MEGGLFEIIGAVNTKARGLSSSLVQPRGTLAPTTIYLGITIRGDDYRLHICKNQERIGEKRDKKIQSVCKFTLLNILSTLSIGNP